jgi:hypothetical protein
LTGKRSGVAGCAIQAALTPSLDDCPKMVKRYFALHKTASEIGSERMSG